MNMLTIPQTHPPAEPTRCLTACSCFLDKLGCYGGQGYRPERETFSVRFVGLRGKKPQDHAQALKATP